jgi:hypothetical protein
MEEHEAKLMEKLIDALLITHQKQTQNMQDTLANMAGFAHLRKIQTPEIETE